MRRATLPQLIGLAGWLALAYAVAALGAIASVEARSFYAQLAQPPWAPPAGVFAPVWSTLYGLMGLAAWLVWREKRNARVAPALGLFVAQLAINALWSWLFFAWHLGAWAFVDVVILVLVIVATIAAFARVSRLAALLLVPYLAWVGFASALTWAVWQRNPGLL